MSDKRTIQINNERLFKDILKLLETTSDRIIEKKNSG